MEGVEWKVSLQMDTSTHQRGAACAIIAAHVLADAKLATDFMTFSTAHAAADEWVQTGNTILGLFPENHLRTKFLSASQAHTLVQAFWATGAEELEEQLPQNANAADWCTITSIDLALASLSSNWHTMLPARQSGERSKRPAFRWQMMCGVTRKANTGSLCWHACADAHWLRERTHHANRNVHARRIFHELAPHA